MTLHAFRCTERTKILALRPPAPSHPSGALNSHPEGAMCVSHRVPTRRLVSAPPQNRSVQAPPDRRRNSSSLQSGHRVGPQVASRVAFDAQGRAASRPHGDGRGQNPALPHRTRPTGVASGAVCATHPHSGRRMRYCPGSTTTKARCYSAWVCSSSTRASSSWTASSVNGVTRRNKIPAARSSAKKTPKVPIPSHENAVSLVGLLQQDSILGLDLSDVGSRNDIMPPRS